MADIPVKFDYEGMAFTGSLSRVSGAGASSMFHLYINGYYWGQLWNTDHGWKFGNKDRILEEQYMVDFFVGELRIAGAID